MITNKKQLKFVLFFSLLMLCSGILFSGAQIMPSALYEDNPDYNPNNIISDNDLTNFNSLNAWEIQQFLLMKGGGLAQYTDPNTNLKAADVIYQAANSYRINPKFLLTLIQKEQSLVEDPAPTQKQYDWAAGYSCYAGQCMDEYKGFSAQVNAAANRFMNKYYNDLVATNCTFTNWCVNQSKVAQDGHTITPANRVTAALYTYNPYRGGTITDQGKVGANYNFWKIWHRWFGDHDQVTFWPDGSLLKIKSSSTVYVIQSNYRRPIASQAVLKSRYDINTILTVATNTLYEIPLGPTVKFSQYSLLQTPDDKIYLLVDDTKRLIVSKTAFKKLGFNPEEVEQVNYSDLAYLIDGPDLDSDTQYNLGALVKNPKNGGIYYVISSVKHPIVGPEIIKINFPKLKIKIGTTKQLANYEDGDAVLLKDGTLVKTKKNSAIFVISQGKKYSIPTMETFKSRGYNSKNIVTVSQSVLDIHEDGGTLDPIIIKTAATNNSSTTATTTLNNL